MISNYFNLGFYLDKLVSISQKMENDISKIETDGRNEISEDLLLLIRHFVEKSMICIYIKSTSEDKTFITEQDLKSEAINYILNNTHLLYIYNFHQLLNKTPVGHDLVSFSDYSERLFLSFINKLVLIRLELKSILGIDLLNNLNRYPLNLDNSLLEYYEKISLKLIESRKQPEAPFTENYKINSKKMFFINGLIFYEYSICVIDDNYSKSDKMIAFSDIDIFDKYAVKLNICTKTIELNGIKIDIDIIMGYEVQIRKCEIEKLLSILGIKTKFSKTIEYYNLMNYIKNEKKSIAEIVKFDDKTFGKFEKTVLTSGLDTYLKKLLNLSRKSLQRKEFGINTLLYLLSEIENNLIKNQLPRDSEDLICDSTLRLSKRIYPFEKVPFAAKLPRSSVGRFSTLYEILDIDEHFCELVKRELDKIARDDGIIYSEITKFGNENDVQKLIDDYNFKLGNMTSMRIETIVFKNKKYIYCSQNETDTKRIFDFLSLFKQKVFIQDYTQYITNKISSLGITFSDTNKEIAIKSLFDNKSIFAIYGPAGTGKSFFANIVVSLLDNHSILCLTTTYAAKTNLQKKISSNKPVFKVIENVISSKSEYYKTFDILIIDECSTISNFDMSRLINRVNPKAILLLGDTYQIESIDLGNWFYLFRKVFKHHYIDLNRCFRTNDNALLNFWNKVRNKDVDMQGYMLNHQISQRIEDIEDLLSCKEQNERIILCLNYGGLLGINNINKIVQKSNPNAGFYWRRHIYKVGDPIIFKDNQYFSSIFYNNQKGKIIDIKQDKISLTFTVEVDGFIEKQEEENVEDVTISYLPNNKTKVVFSIKKAPTNLDDDIKAAYVAPFTVGYAISIHKAQGLEFDHVNIIISNNCEEKINHNVFYTAITRAVKTVNIYWTAETENKIIDNFNKENEEDEFAILVNRIFLPLNLM